MKRLFVFAVLFFCFSSIFCLKFKGKDVVVSFKGLTWEKMGGDINALTTFNENIDLLVSACQVSKACGEDLKAKWLRDEKSKTLIVPGNTFHGEFYGGVNSTQKVELGVVTIGNGFDSQFKGQPASAWLLTAEDPFYKRIIDVYWFQTGLNGKTQCNNFTWKFRPLTVEKIVTVREAYTVPGPTVVIHDTVTVTKPCTPAKPCVKISGWSSFAHDAFPEVSADSVNFGNYQLNNFYNSADGHFIFATEQELTAKICLENYAIVANLYHEYEDGPHGFNFRLGFEGNWKRRTFLEVGYELYYRQFAHYWTEENLLSDGSLLIKNRGKYISVDENGLYAQFDQFLDRSGKDHLQIFAYQGLRPASSDLGTSELKGSVKLEPGRFYAFLGGKYQFTPYEAINDTLRAPKFEHFSWEPRIGFSLSKSMIFFLRHRGINHNEWNDEDELNSWSRYTRRDFSAGLFFRPNKMFGIKNLHCEFLAGFSRIKERYENNFLDREDDLMEIKFTLFYNWKF